MSVDASFGLSFQKLEPKLRQTFLDLSVFPGDFDSQAEEQICQDEGHRSLSELVRWSLVDYKAQGQDYGRYKLHDLARIFALARQEEEQKARHLLRAHASYYKDLLSAADDLYLKGGDEHSWLVSRYSIVRKQISLAGQAWAAKSMARYRCRRTDMQELSGCWSACSRSASSSQPGDSLAGEWSGGGERTEGSFNGRGPSGQPGQLTPVWASPVKPSSSTSRPWPSPGRSATGQGQGASPGQPGDRLRLLGEPRKAIEFYEQARASLGR